MIIRTVSLASALAVPICCTSRLTSFERGVGRGDNQSVRAGIDADRDPRCRVRLVLSPIAAAAHHSAHQQRHACPASLLSLALRDHQPIGIDLANDVGDVLDLRVLNGNQPRLGCDRDILRGCPSGRGS